MHVGRPGGRGRWRQTEGTLPGDCNLGAELGEDKLARVTQRKIKALGLDWWRGWGEKKVLEEMKEQAVRMPILGRSLPFLHDK